MGSDFTLSRDSKYVCTSTVDGSTVVVLQQQRVWPLPNFSLKKGRLFNQYQPTVTGISDRTLNLVVWVGILHI